MRHPRHPQHAQAKLARSVKAVHLGLEILTIGVMFACTESSPSQDDLSESSESDMATIEQPAYVKSGSIWHSRRLDLCWEQDGFTEEGEWARRMIENTWAAETALVFNGWNDQCSSTALSRNVRMILSNDQGSALELGNDLDDVPGGVNLDLYQEYAPTVRRLGFEAMATHEFGHVLSFSHEQNNTEITPEWCQEAPQGADGDIQIGPWDALSIMNYCNYEYYDNYGRLSGGDIAAATRFYGAGHPHAAVHLLSDDRLMVFARGQVLGNGEDVYVRTLDYLQDTWSTWESLGTIDGEHSTSAPAAHANWNGVHVVVRTSTGSLATRYRSGEGWSSWQDLGGFVVGQPIVFGDMYRTVVVVRNRDNGMSVLEGSGGAWGAWTNIPSSVDQGPVGKVSGVVAQNGVLHIFATWRDGTVRGIKSDTPGVWSGYINFTGSSIGSPTAVAMTNSTGMPDVYLFARDIDGGVRYRRLTAPPYPYGLWSDWTQVPWESIAPGGVRSNVAAVSRREGVVEIFYRDSLGNIFSTTLNSDGTTFLRELTGSGGVAGSIPEAVGSIEAVSLGHARIELFLMTNYMSTFPFDGRLYQSVNLHWDDVNDWSVEHFGWVN